MSVKVEAKTVTETIVTITMNEDVALKLEAVLRLVRFYDEDGNSTGLSDLEDLYNDLPSGYESAIVGDAIVLEKF